MRNKSDIRRANPLTDKSMNKLKFPELNIASLYSLKSKRSEKAKTKTKNETNPFRAVIFFSCSGDFFLAILCW